MDYALHLPSSYFLALATTLILLAESAFRWKTPWAVPAGMIYLTIFGWYLVEPIYTPATMRNFSADSISAAFVSVFIFLSAFRLSCSTVAGLLVPSERAEFASGDLPAERVLWISIVLWLLLLAFGVSRVDGDLIGALLPIGARTELTMWARPAGIQAGTFGFFISICAYMYVLVLAIFGMVLPLLKSRGMQILCVFVILVSWPYAFLQGSRNIALAVFLPFVFSFVLFTRFKIYYKVIFIAATGVFLEWAMRQIITYRNFGFETTQTVKEEGHLGLNMGSELVYCIDFLKSGIIKQQWGWNFMTELFNVVPRFLWPDKPLIGIDYTLARGFGNGGNDIGVIATISTGVIGQGVLDFGPYLGPAFMALLMAFWAGFLARLWAQGTVARACLFLVGLGLTFNLGRNFTLLVLWPMVFAYVLVLAAEKYGARKTRSAAATAQDGMLFDL